MGDRPPGNTLFGRKECKCEHAQKGEDCKALAPAAARGGFNVENTLIHRLGDAIQDWPDAGQPEGGILVNDGGGLQSTGVRSSDPHGVAANVLMPDERTTSRC